MGVKMFRCKLCNIITRTKPNSLVKMLSKETRYLQWNRVLFLQVAEMPLRKEERHKRTEIKNQHTVTKSYIFIAVVWSAGTKIKAFDQNDNLCSCHPNKWSLLWGMEVPASCCGVCLVHFTKHMTVETFKKHFKTWKVQWCFSAATTKPRFPTQWSKCHSVKHNSSKKISKNMKEVKLKKERKFQLLPLIPPFTKYK